MDIIPHKTPLWLKQLYPKRIWDCAETQKNTKTIYLSFDDGPIPKITPWVIDILNQYNAKASFFCIGENLLKQPSIAKHLLKEGHSLGNHTFHHVNGWNTTLHKYADEVHKTEKLFKELGIKSELFRPPYGKMTSSQADFVLNKNYKIIMWDVLTKDYNPNLTAEKLLKKSIQATTQGSIVVFHDSQKAFKNLEYILPKYLEHFKKLGYDFKKL